MGPASSGARLAGRYMRRAVVTLVALLALLGTGIPTATARSGPEPAACPAAIATAATCFAGRDTTGAYYSIAIPNEWNGSLVMHAHGGPDLEPADSDPQRSADDLERWTVMVREGYAWAGSSYRRGGYGAEMAARDTESLRRLFVREFGEPRKTLLHGQSWGGNIAAKIAEGFGTDAKSPYAGVLLTNGLLAGGSRGYDYRVDLRVVYQYYCGNHPRPTEPQYPLWMGLPAKATMTEDDLRGRLQECTGYASSPTERSAVQQRKLDEILAVTRIPERSLESHLKFATFTFRDIVHNRLGGRNPFSNLGVRYSGSRDDAALNAGVERFAADRSARRDLSYDSDPTGAVSVPVLTLHAIGDPTVFVEQEAAYRASLAGAGSGGYLVQTFTAEDEHSGLSDAEYANSIAALSSWVDTGRKPTPHSVAASCAAFDASYATGCFYRPDYAPASYASKVRPRPGGTQWPALTAKRAERWRQQGDVGIAP
ncbi:hypothetical protein EV191_102242 [Tamaricihabitans halophyticus]|uniref:Alpha/beta hydrolase family protein n=1 Tax=Tamaricihabitans halophyticus TaxID=1262583 RepID=A0A4R2QXU1_9PSEU|nr:hypothetical protein [Tamaricihabitans halophyticus]TCP55030.1 hypothetical protein EV191_102242 [Tamaricihabitans halophyticus]